MSKIMQNLVVLMEPSKDAYVTPLKGGKMILNLFCIDEDAAFVLSEVIYLKKTSNNIKHGKNSKLIATRGVKGKKYSILGSNFILRTFIFMNN